MSDDGRVDLADFLLARLAEDEAVARAATGEAWTTDKHAGESSSFPGQDYTMWSVDCGDIEVVTVEYDRDYNLPAGGCERQADAEHIARWDPARVLAECEAKRKQVGELLSWTDARTTEDQSWALERGDRAEQLAVATLRLLALPYADHPDYDESWRP